MLAFIILFFITLAAFLLLLDNNVKAALDDICWLNSPDDLAESELSTDDCPDTQIALEWSRLWDCAGLALQSGVRRQVSQVIKSRHRVRQRLLFLRKRDELGFSFRISSLHQLMACRHASGADGDAVAQTLFIPKAQCAFSPLCFFLS